MDENHVVEATIGSLRLRAEGEHDGAFLRDLFAAGREATLRSAGLQQAQIDMMIDLQHRSRSHGYASQFPRARFQIVELAGEAIGRLVEDDEAETIYVVDIAIAPASQRRGAARALIADLQTRSRAAGKGVRALVARDNTASLALFAGLGFAAVSTDEIYAELLWRGGV